MSPSLTPGRAPRVLRSLAGATALAIVGTGLAATPSAALLPDETVIQLLSINDFHGRIAKDGQAAGAGILACTVKEYEAANPNTLFVSAGDSVGASTFPSSVANDTPTLDVLNLMDLDVSAFGNHEFDKGQADVNGRIVPASAFPYVSANIYGADGKRVYDAYEVIAVDGVDVGFVGAITEEMPSLVSPTGIAGLEFRDIATEVNAVSAMLSDGDVANGEADVVVVLVHDGAASPDLASATGTGYGDLLANADENIDAIISGHTHQVYAQQLGGVWVTQSAQYGEQMGQLTFTVNRLTGAVGVATAQNIDLVNSAGVGRCTPDAGVKAIVDKALVDAKVLGAVKVGRITADFNRAQHEVKNANTGLMEISENRGGESTIGNFIADVQLWAAQQAGADIAVINPGGIRANLKYLSSGTEGDGVVTYEEAANVQSFANTIMVTKLTGAQVYTMLEQQWQPTGASRPFLKLGVSDGLDYTYDPTAAAGSRILDVTLDGVALDRAGIYTVAANSFLMGGGDNFTVFKSGSGTRDTGWVDLDGMVQYFEASGWPVAPDAVQRAIGVDWVTDPAAVYAAGDPLTVKLSSLSFSSATDVKPTSLTVSLGGVSLGTVAVDTAYVATTDEIGRATVDVTVPPGIGGLVDLVVTDPATGTTVTLGVAVAQDMTAVEAYITQVYNDLLGRGPDPVGLKGWTAALLAGVPYAEVANGITYSDEYRARLIAASYQTYLGRGPDPAGAADWLAAMRAGTTIQEMEAGFVASIEYYAKSGGTNADWVRALYQHVLGRAAADAEVTAWTNALAAGGSRHQVAMGFLVSTEHLTDVVDGHYQHLLGRGIDPVGAQGWVVAIQSGVRVEAVIAGIVASDEYRNAV